MKLNKIHGNLDQLIDAGEARIRELGGDADVAACDKITASFGQEVVDFEDDSSKYELIARKDIYQDGERTDYAMYRDPDTGEYFFMFGDMDIYPPDPDYADWTCESEDCAWEWFDSYEFDGDVDHYEDIEESTNTCGIAARPAVSEVDEDADEVYGVGLGLDITAPSMSLDVEAAEGVDADAEGTFLNKLMDKVDELTFDQLSSMMWDSDDENVYLTVTAHDGSNVTELTIPHGDLTFDLDKVDDDADVIVNEISDAINRADVEEPRKYQRWNDVYDQFEVIVDTYWPDIDKIHEEVDKFYETGKGNAFFEEAYRRWNDTPEEG